MSQSEINFIDKFQIKIDGNPEYSNIIDKDFPQGLTSFLKSLGPNDDQTCESITKIITNIVDEFMANSENNIHPIFFVRASSDIIGDNDVPHIDFCPPVDKVQINSGISIALKGPSTIFYDIPLKDKQEYEQKEIEREQDTTYKEFDPRIIEYKHSYNVNAGIGNGAAFLGACQGALHKAPGIYEPRLFLLSFPGNQALIELQKTRVLEQAEDAAEDIRKKAEANNPIDQN